MELDNGLVCKNFPFKTFRGSPVSNTGCVEFCYWRNCWNFRDEVMDYLNQHNLLNQDGYSSKKLNIFQLEDIRNILEKYTHLDYVERNNNTTIWESKDTEQYMLANLDDFDKFLSIMRLSPGLLVYFYDSY